MWAQFVSSIPQHEAALLHVLLHVVTLDVLSQAVGHILLPADFDDSQLSSANSLFPLTREPLRDELVLRLSSMECFSLHLNPCSLESPPPAPDP